MVIKIAEKQNTVRSKPLPAETRNNNGTKTPNSKSSEEQIPGLVSFTLPENSVFQ